jgi:photosystem II stability/assembly factor-like uncharacterized protein
MITNLLIIDLKIKDIEIILKSTNDQTTIILIDFNNDNFNILEEKIKSLKIKNLKRIGLIREEYFDTYYKLFNDQTFFILQNIKYLDPELETWDEFILFLKRIKENYYLESFDFISCNLNQYEDYKFIFNKLEIKLNIKIYSTTNQVGNINWNLENINSNFDYINLKDIYFNQNINNYTGNFGSTFDLTITPSNPLTNYSTSTKLNISYSTSLLPGVNSFWEKVNTISGSLSISGNVNNFFMLANKYGFAVANNSVTISTNGGVSWNRVTNPYNNITTSFNMQILDIFAWDQNNFIIWGNTTSSSSKIFKTINSGTSWIDISGDFNNSNIFCMTFINDIGYIGCGGNIYRSINYGFSWINLNQGFNGNITKIIMVSTLNIYLITSTKYFYYSVDGGCTFNGVYTNPDIVASVTDIASVDPNTIFAINTTLLQNATLSSMNFTNRIYPTVYTVNAMIMPNTTIFYLFTTLYYIYSINNRTSWNAYTYNITTTLSKFLLNDYAIYALGADNNLYRLYITYPGSLNFYNNNNLLKTITMNKQYENTVYLSNLNLGVNNIYCYYYSNDSKYNSISSIFIQLNVQQSAPYTYTISSSINYSSTIKLYTAFNSLIYESNTFFIKINTTPICQGTPYKIRMVNNFIGYCCSTTGFLGRTLDGGITWSIINTGIQYISNTKNKIIDIYAWDISNILIASGWEEILIHCSLYFTR